jgi:hypothetical protein
MEAFWKRSPGGEGEKSRAPRPESHAAREIARATRVRGNTDVRSTDRRQRRRSEHDHGSRDVAGFERVERVIDVVERDLARDELVEFQIAGPVQVEELGGVAVDV